MLLRTYDDAEAFLNGFVNYEKLLGGPIRYDTTEFDLGSFRRLLHGLGDPHLNFAVIHVAGTKGKGSTCAFLEAILRAAGIRTGLYTSPHISRYTERIAVSGQPISDERFCALLSGLSDAINPAPEGTKNSDLRVQNSDSPGFRTVFELLTAAAFLHFSEENVQVAIVETGLGGRLDSTNVFDVPGAGPLITVITPIALDHTAVLGDTIEKIASEKAGILRPHGITVLAPQPPTWADTVRSVVESRLHAVGVQDYFDAAQLVQWPPVPPEAPGDHESEPDQECSPDESSAAFTFNENAWRRLMHAHPSSLAADILQHQPLPLRPSLSGAHQLDNLRTVLCVLAALNLPGLTTDAIRRGVAETRWPGRFEILMRDPLVIIDGAHCPLSARAASATFIGLYGPDREVILVAGFLRDKPAEEIAAALKGRLRIAHIIACTPPTPRARPAAESAEALHRTLGANSEAIPDPAEAVRTALSRRSGNQAVLIFGSMYLIGPATTAVREAQQTESRRSTP